MSSELEALKELWLQIDGNEMPEDTAAQPIEIVRKSVHWRRQGVIGIVPKEVVAVPASEDDSLAEWDSQDEKHLNAYGS